ncbi:polyadenylate-binding protein-interacting protein 1-like isoform X2 [Panonychus citri]|uniref:polyadenylate-binding protein-interacting protein 1-like isoform X2 n=1 Tax=Panonychus citri TaxID=50023 RepID=UPI002308327D|nr:polyadenylate-binding protein-interacting protein 1-like isoform X2 [Panonychus citri]
MSSSKSNNQTEAKDDATKKWTLNPEAAEFVPRFASNVPTQSPGMGSFKPMGSGNSGTGSSMAGTTGPPSRASKAYHNGNDWSENDNEFVDPIRRESDTEVEDYVALSELKEFIDAISSNPAQYDAEINYITEVLNNWITEDPDIIMQCIVNTIVDQGIIDTNFRYNGVRLCVHLIANLKAITSKGSFKDILLQRCQREISRRDSMAKASDGGQYSRGVALFIADLSTRVDDPDLVEALPELIETLLSHTTTDNVKCACNILKLCGTHLEDYLKKKNSDTMDTIFDRLKGISSRSQVSDSLKNVINNVVEFRANNWKTPSLPSNIVNPYATGANNPYNDYNPQSNNHHHYQNYGHNPSYDFGPCGDEGDQDVCDAFEEFLRDSGQLQ